MEPDNGHDCNWLGNQIDFIGNCELTVNEPKLVKLQFVSLFSFVFFQQLYFFICEKFIIILLWTLSIWPKSELKINLKID